MANRKEIQQQTGLTKRQERAQRILQTAAELVQRWGYNKTTIDDIARQAGVAKGTIYLHWKTREDLFLALVIQEWSNTAQEILQRILDDPQGFLLHRIMKHAIGVLLRRPLMHALFIQDTDLLGGLAQHLSAEYNRENNFAAQRSAAILYLFDLLRSKGLLRTDMSVETQISILSSITFGFLLTDRYLPERYHLSSEQTAEMVEETIRRVFEPEQPIDPETLKEVDASLTATYTNILQALQKQALQVLGS